MKARAGRFMHAAYRGIAFLAISFAAVVHYFVAYRGARAADRARWQKYWGQRFAWLLGLEIEIHGRIPRGGLIVANHLGYVDILVLSAIMPCVFVAKAEVARWPILGALARLAGTVFIDRTRRLAVGAANAQVDARMREGLSVVLFPEGTSSDGRTVLPFKASLLEPSCRAGAAITPAAIDYRLDAGSVATEVCYWGEMTLLPHLFRLFQQPRVYARVSFGPTYREAGSRKELARALRDHVAQLREPETGLLLLGETAGMPITKV